MREGTPQEQAASIEAAGAVLRRMVTELPPELQPTLRRTLVEAEGDDAMAFMRSWYDRQTAAEEAAFALSKEFGAEGFFPPSQSFGCNGSSMRPSVFAFRSAPAAADGWIKANDRSYSCRSGTAPYRPGKKPAGHKLKARLDALPQYPSYREGADAVGIITDLCSRDGNQSSGVGSSDGKLHFTTCIRIEERFFVNFPNWNYDIAKRAQDRLAYPAYGTASDFDYADDPIGWRPPEGWTLLGKPQFEVIFAEANLRIQRAALAKALLPNPAEDAA